MLEKYIVFQDLTSSERAEIHEFVCWKEYKTGEAIVLHLEDSDDIFLIDKGSVRSMCTGHKLSR